MNHLLFAVDGDSAFADQNLHTVLLIEAFAYQRQLFCRVVREVRREVDTVVGDAGFFTEDGNIELAGVGFIENILNKTVADHAITDNCESDFAHFCLDFYSNTAYLNDSAIAIIDSNQFSL